MSARLLLTVTLVCLPAPVVAQSYASRSPVPAIAAKGGPRPIDSAVVAAELARADEATANGRVSDARRIYKRLIAELKDSDQIASTPMWRLALSYLYEGDYWNAALKLDELASASNTYGDPTMELRATFESGLMWQQLKRYENVNSRVARVKALLQSPVIPEAEKESVRRRIGD